MNLSGFGCVLCGVTENRDDHGVAEEDLLRAVARGDRVAFTELYDRTTPWLAGRLRRRCGTASEVEEIVQDTFLVVWRSAGGFSGSGSAAGWIWTIARNRMIHLARQSRAGVGLVEGDDLRLPPSPSAEQLALSDLYGAQVETALASLSPQLRLVLQATVLDGMSVRETASYLGIPEGTVRTRAFRARQQLRKAMS